jgi:hypothetical protein
MAVNIKAFTVWTGLATLLIIIILIILTIVMYIKRVGLYTKYVAKRPTDKSSANYYYPNGDPENAGNYLNSSIQTQVNTQVNAYKATDPANSADDWGANTN